MPWCWSSAPFAKGCASLRALGIPILPPRNGILYNWLPEPVLVGLLSRLLRLQIYQYALIHAGHARPELQSLAVEFSALSRASCVPTPNLNLLCAATDPNASLIAEGSAHIPMDWSQAWAKLAVLASGLLVLRLVREHSVRSSTAASSTSARRLRGP